MKTFEITYKATGSQRLDKIWISEADFVNEHRVANIVDAIECFEKTAEEWGTYENKNAIVNIAVLEK